MALLQSKLQGTKTDQKRVRKTSQESPFDTRLRRVGCPSVRKAFYIPHQIEKQSVPKGLRQLYSKRDEEELKSKMPELLKPLSSENYLVSYIILVSEISYLCSKCI